MAGTVFGEVGVLLFVAGATFRRILRDSRSAKRCIFHTKCISKMGGVSLRSGGCKMTNLSSDHARIIVGLSSNRVKQFKDFPLKS